MKKMFFIMLLFCSMMSCTMHEHGGLSVEKGKIMLKFKVVETAATKGYVQVSEAVVSDLNVFVYDSENKLFECRYISDISEGVSVDVNTKEDVSVYILANVGDYTSDKALRSVDGMESAVWKFADISEMAAESGALPMTGKVEKRKFANDEEVTVNLTRLVAKLRIKVDTTLLDNNVELFDIQKVRIRNINSSIGFFTKSRAERSDYIIKDGGSKEGVELSDLYGGGVDFYIPENAQGNLLSGNEEESRHIPPLEYAGLCTYLEILVKYRNKEHYNDSLVYRYYIHNGNMDNFDVLRNTMYVCRTWFHGSGINENSWRVDVSGMKDLVTSVEVFPDSMKFTQEGDIFQFYAEVLPVSAENNELMWSSDNVDVVTVDQTGMVSVVGDGVCKITAMATDGTGIYGTADVSVDIYKYPQSVKITPETSAIFIDETIVLSAKIFPEAANDKEVVWTSTDNSIATVSQDGIVCGVDYGKAGIIATTKVGNMKDTAYVTVAEKVFRLDDIPEELYPNYNTPYTITYTANPPAVPEFSITPLAGWEEAAYLTGNIINARNPWMESGMIAAYQLVAKCNGINVSTTFELSGGEIAIDKNRTTFYIGLKNQLTLSALHPADVDVRWTSSDKSVAIVDSKGNVTPLREGSCTIRATSVTGIYDECTIQVVTPKIELGTLFNTIEGRSFNLYQYLKSVTTKELAIGYRIVSGSEYVTLNETGLLRMIKRSGKENVTIEAYFLELPSVYSRTTFSVKPAVTASLAGPDKIVNTIGQVATNGADWSGFDTQTRVSGGHLSSTMTWEIYDGNGISVGRNIDVSSNGTVTPTTAYVNGTFYIIGWDVTHKFSTDTIKIEIYKLLEYELGVDGLDNFNINQGNEYLLTLYARWYAGSFNKLIPAEKAWLNRQKIISYQMVPSVFYEITTAGTPFVTDITATYEIGPNGEILDNNVVLPENHSYLRKSFEDEVSTVSGVSGQYYKMTNTLNGFQGYYFIKQRHTKYYNCDTGNYL